MDHMKNWWNEEMKQFRAVVRNHTLFLSSHGEERMDERGLTALELMMVIMTGRIVEGWDVGRYPGYRNPDPLRMVISEFEGKKIVVGVAIRGENKFCITTCYEAKSDSGRVKYYF